MFMGATLLILGFTLYIPLFRSLFHFQLFPAINYLVVIVSAFLSIAWSEAIKLQQKEAIVEQQ
jgi:hypothetical protein